MIIDAHQHFWQYDPARHAWIDDTMQALRRDFLPEHLEPVLKQHSVAGCVAVQADQTESETHFLLDLAEKNPFILGVIGWVDLRAGNISERLAYFSQFKKLKGFRHIVQAESDVNFLLRPDFKRGVSLLEKFGFTYDILIYPHQMGAALELVSAFPNQRFILDHLGKPYIRDGYLEGWSVLIRALAKRENVHCKVSGLVTEADLQHWKYADFLPYLDAAFEAFGAERLLFGSDWPVCLLGGDYTQIKSILDQYLAPFSATEKALVWGGNAAKVMQLGV